MRLYTPRKSASRVDLDIDTVELEAPSGGHPLSLAGLKASVPTVLFFTFCEGGWGGCDLHGVRVSLDAGVLRQTAFKLALPVNCLPFEICTADVLASARMVTIFVPLKIGEPEQIKSKPGFALVRWYPGKSAHMIVWGKVPVRTTNILPNPPKAGWGQKGKFALHYSESIIWWALIVPRQKRFCQGKVLTHKGWQWIDTADLSCTFFAHHLLPTIFWQTSHVLHAEDKIPRLEIRIHLLKF